MKTDTTLKEILEQMLIKLEVPFDKVIIKSEDQNGTDLYRINIETEDPSILIGFHGENIHSLQHLVKVIAWKQTQKDFNILLDVDNYRQRQEDNVISLTEKKIEMAKKTKKTQVLPPMSPYFRRVVHLYIANAGYDNIKTESIGNGDHRQVTIVYEN
ncbi:KH domain-containing protein [bacterium]|nr:KH domain-containing protein [bacterium]